MQAFIAAPASPSRGLSSESSFGGHVHPTDPFDHVASLSSTPPTTVADSMSLASEASKLDHIHARDSNTAIHDSTSPMAVDDHAAEPIIEAALPDNMATFVPAPTPSSADVTPAGTPNGSRTRRNRVSAPVYNLAKLSGTAGHGKRRAKGDIVSNRRRRRKTDGELVSPVDLASAAPEDLDSMVLDDATTKQPTPDATPSTTPPHKGRKKSRATLPANFKTEAAAGGAIDDVYDIENAFSITKGQKSRASSNAQPKSKVTSATKSTIGKKKEAQEEPSKRISTRASGSVAESVVSKVSSLGKRSRKVFEQSTSRMSRELRRLKDTDEFAKIDSKPVLYTTWANGKFIDPDATPEPEPPKKKAKLESPKKSAEPEPTLITGPLVKERRVKKWLDRGLYAGQNTPKDATKSLTAAEKKELATMPELLPREKPNNFLPQPIYSGFRLLLEGRDFKLPWDVCNPLPPGQPKPSHWRHMTKNRFIGEAGAIWKKSPHFKDYQSMCVCTPDDPCGESCQNRIMLYECDSTNCNVGKDICQNRAFADLTERTKIGGKFRVGVEVIKTEDRGYGIRANRCFEPHEIIMEYTGEIITEEECDRRMNEKYKDNECYYLMSFDQNMIIDATTGSIARFVNHSCTPNCRMIKWIVSGHPRMALFAGDKPIMTGDELTYDYNFDPFSAKNVQKCLCGSSNCRGVLGPKPKEVKVPKPSKQELAKAAKKKAAAAKRKLSQAAESDSPVKKRKITSTAKALALKAGIKKPASKTAKGAATVIKRTVSTVAVKAKGTPGTKKMSAGKVAASVRKSSVVKTFAAAKVQTKLGASRGTPKKGGVKGQKTLSILGSDKGKKGTKKKAQAKPAKAGKSKA